VLLDRAQAVERQFGRDAEGAALGTATLDIDLIRMTT